jgi:phage tail sheath gpL-like
MPLNLNVIPVGWQVPGAYLGVDNSGAVAGIPAQRKPVLLVGLRRSTGTIAQAVVKPITSIDQGATYFGRGSQLAAMVEKYWKANPYSEVYAVALDEDAAGVKATSTLTITGPATGDGTLTFVWGDRLRKVSVTSGQTATEIAAAIAAADTADGDSQTTSAAVAAVVTASARHKGAYGNDLSIVHNYYVGDKTPAGVTVTITAFASGATNPDITDALAALGGDTLYYTIVSGFSDDTNMDALEAELLSRADAIRQIPGLSIGAFRGNHSDSSPTATHATRSSTSSWRQASRRPRRGAGLLPPPRSRWRSTTPPSHGRTSGCPAA